MENNAIYFNHNTATITSTGDSVVNIDGRIKTICHNENCNRKETLGEYLRCPSCGSENVTYSAGALLIGDGENIDLNEETEKEGILCVTKDAQKGYQLKASNKNGSWDVLGEPYDDSMDMIYVIIMSH